MKQFNSYLPIFLALVLCSLSCKKKTTVDANCFANDPTSRQILNAKASIQIDNGQVYIVEQGTIDTKLIPCNLPEGFQVQNLEVTISGNVKVSMQYGPGPCCVENFEILKITR